MKLRILIADDDQFARFGLRQLIRSRTPHQIVGEAANGQEACDLALAKKPHVIVMDAAMPGMDGIEATRRILENSPDARILVVSMHDEEKWVRAMFRAGARGFVLKESGVAILKDAIETVAAGKYYVDEGMITDVVMRDYVRQLGQRGSTADGLTKREREVLRLIGEGLHAKGIAGRLSLSVRTVHGHTQNIMSKLGIHSMAGLAAYAVRHGLTPDPAEQSR